MMSAHKLCIRMGACAINAVCLIVKCALISIYACIAKTITGISLELVWMHALNQHFLSCTHCSFAFLVPCIAAHVIGMIIVSSAILHLLRWMAYVLMYVI